MNDDKSKNLNMNFLLYSAVTLTMMFLPAIGLAETKQFKVLELDQNSTGPYAIFSGGTNDGLQKNQEVCVLKDASDEKAFCAEIVNVKKQAAAFYIPAGHQFEVMMGTLVTAEIDAAGAEKTEPVADESEPQESSPWLLPGSAVEVGYHMQVTPAIKTSSMSFDPLPRTDTNAPWKSRDAMNLALIGISGGYAKNFLNPGHQLGIRGFYAQSAPAGFDNDYDLTDTISHVESNTIVKTVGLSIFYGIEKKSTDEFSLRGSAGIGVRRAQITMTGDLKAANNQSLVSADLVATAPVIDMTGGATYKLWGIDWSANLLLGIPLNVKATSSGTFKEFQDVSQADVEANVTDAAAIQKGVEIGLGIGLLMAI